MPNYKSLPGIRHKGSMFTLFWPLLRTMVLAVPVRAIRKEKEIIAIQI